MSTKLQKRITKQIRISKKIHISLKLRAIKNEKTMSKLADQIIQRYLKKYD